MPDRWPEFVTSNKTAPLWHAEPLDRDALTAVNERHATTVVGPPLATGPLATGPLA